MQSSQPREEPTSSSREEEEEEMEDFFGDDSEFSVCGDAIVPGDTYWESRTPMTRTEIESIIQSPSLSQPQDNAESQAAPPPEPMGPPPTQNQSTRIMSTTRITGYVDFSAITDARDTVAQQSVRQNRTRRKGPVGSSSSSSSEGTKRRRGRKVIRRRRFRPLRPRGASSEARGTPRRRTGSNTPNSGTSVAMSMSSSVDDDDEERRASSESSSSSTQEIVRRVDRSNQGDDSETPSSCLQSREQFVAKRLMEEERKRVLRLIQGRENCFGCMWARKDFAKVEQQHLDLLESFFETRYSKMSMTALTDVMAKIYISNLQIPYRDKGMHLPDWPKEMIEEHILYHMLDPDVVFTEVLQTFFSTFMEMKDSLFVEKKVLRRITNESEIDPITGNPMEYEYETTKWIPDTRNIRCALEVARALREFFKMSNSEFATERKRTRVRNLSPSLVCAERVRFSSRRSGGTSF